MKRFLAAATLAGLLVLAVGCGGGSGGSGSSGGGGGSTVSDDAVFAGTNAPANLTELSPTDSVQFQFFSTSSQGTTTSVSPSSYTTNAPSTVATVTSTGLLSAVGPSSLGSDYKVTAKYSGKTYTFPLSVGSPAAKVSGTVQSSLAGQLDGVTINFYGPSGIVASAVTGSDGSFLANVPATATSLNVGLANFATYYSVFYYGALTYSASIAGCNVALPPISVGTTTALPNAIVLLPIDLGNPPPPPNGCNA